MKRFDCLSWSTVSVLSLAFALSPALEATAQDQAQPSTVLPPVERMEAVADNLDKIHKALDVAGPSLPRRIDDPLGDVAIFSVDFADLALALRRDIAEHRILGRNDSHTTDALAKIALDQYTNPDRLRELQKLGLISKPAMRSFGFLAFGAADVTQGTAMMVSQRRFGDPIAAAKVLDGISSTALGVYGYALTGNWKVAQAYASAGGVLTSTGRAWTLPAFEAVTGRVSGTDDKIVALWEEAQSARIAHGLRPIPIEQFYKSPSEAATLDLVGKEALAEANRRLGLDEVLTRRTTSHYRETCVSGSCWRVDPSASTSEPPLRPLGGVRLDRPLSGARLRGVVIGPKGDIILIGEPNLATQGLSTQDLAMALWLEFGSQPIDPAFSLDPADPRHPDGPWLRARYLPPLMQGRTLGADLFSADLQLKELSLGVHLGSDHQVTSWHPKVPGFSTLGELAMSDPSHGADSEQWSRAWIVANRVTVRRAGNAMLIDAQMGVQARSEVPDPHSATGLRDVATDPHSVEARWAGLATAHYDALAQQLPALERIREAAVAVAIAKTLRASGAQINGQRLAQWVNSDRTPTVERINAFAVTLRHRTDKPFVQNGKRGVLKETRSIRIFGGVDLTVRPDFLLDTTGLVRRETSAAVEQFQRSTPAIRIVQFEFGGERLSAIALPLLQSAPQTRR